MVVDCDVSRACRSIVENGAVTLLQSVFDCGSLPQSIVGHLAQSIPQLVHKQNWGGGGGSFACAPIVESIVLHIFFVSSPFCILSSWTFELFIHLLSFLILSQMSDLFLPIVGRLWVDCATYYPRKPMFLRI